MGNNIVAFVHAKGTSERVPDKNLKVFGDKPLFCHAIQHALESTLVTKVVIDSDSDEILKIGEAQGAIPLKRSQELASNAATGDDLAYWQASSYPDSDIVLQVIPTSPFLQSVSIDRALRLLDEKNVDSVVGVFAEAFYQWQDGRPVYFNADGSIPNSSDMDPVIYETTGLYVNRTRFVLEHKKRMNAENCAPCFLSRIEAIDINTPEDFEFAQTVWKGLCSE